MASEGGHLGRPVDPCGQDTLLDLSQYKGKANWTWGSRCEHREWLLLSLLLQAIRLKGCKGAAGREVVEQRYVCILICLSNRSIWVDIYIYI